MIEQDAQRRLLEEIGLLSDRIRELRSNGAADHKGQIDALETQAREKWQQLRGLRAGPAASDPSILRGGGRHQ